MRSQLQTLSLLRFKNEYKKCLKEQHSISLDKRIEKYYNLVTSYIKNDFINIILWKELIDNHKEFNDEYRIESKRIFPDNWFTRINYIPRISILVKYIGGVEFILNNLKS